MKLPIQPTYEDKHGVTRFKANKIVDDLYDFAQNRGFSLNDIAVRGYSREEREQFAQLIGYSLSGFSELSYASEETLCAAQLMHEKGVSELEARCAYLSEELEAIKSSLREPMARLFQKHPDDLQ